MNKNPMLNKTMKCISTWKWVECAFSSSNVPVTSGLVITLALLGLSAPSDTLAAVVYPIDKPAVPQLDYQPAEVGKILFNFPEINEGGWGRAEEAIMMNGYLYYAGMLTNKGWVWDMQNPRKPILVTKTDVNQNVHTIPVMGNYMWVTGIVADMKDPGAPKRVGSGPATAWQHLQYPYCYSTYNYNNHPMPLQIAKYSETMQGSMVTTFDANSKLSFTIGTVHVIGNIMILSSGEKFAGVSTWDLSDPLKPKLMASTNEGTPQYFSAIYGHYIVTTGGPSEGKTTIFSFEDPYNLKKIWSGTPEGMGDYAHFQNGYMYGALNGKFCKFNMETFVNDLVGVTNGIRYATPMGNLVWVGTWDGYKHSPSLSVHDAKPDRLGPKVLYASPDTKAVRQALTTRIGLVFDEDIDNRSLTADNFQVTDQKGVQIEGWISSQRGILTFTPKQPLKTEMAYVVRIPKGGLRDWAGNGVREEFMMAFTTGASLSGVTLGIASTKALRAQYSGRLEFDGKTLKVRAPGSTQLGGASSANGDASIASFTDVLGRHALETLKRQSGF